MKEGRGGGAGTLFPSDHLPTLASPSTPPWPPTAAPSSWAVSWDLSDAFPLPASPPQQNLKPSASSLLSEPGAPAPGLTNARTDGQAARLEGGAGRSLWGHDSGWAGSMGEEEGVEHSGRGCGDGVGCSGGLEEQPSGLVSSSSSSLCSPTRGL